MGCGVAGLGFCSKTKAEDRSATVDLAGALSASGTVIKPVAWLTRATGGRAVEVQNPAAAFPDVDHAAGDEVLAEDANALVIERSPAAIGIVRSQRCQLPIQWNSLVHFAE